VSPLKDGNVGVSGQELSIKDTAPGGRGVYAAPAAIDVRAGLVLGDDACVTGVIADGTTCASDFEFDLEIVSRCAQ
jgi:hypothetical protein